MIGEQCRSFLNHADCRRDGNLETKRMFAERILSRFDFRQRYFHRRRDACDESNRDAALWNTNLGLQNGKEEGSFGRKRLDACGVDASLPEP